MNLILPIEIIMAMVWISLWGLIENLVEKFVPADHYDKRILVYLVAFIISVVLLYFLYTQRPPHDDNTSEDEQELTGL